MAVIIQECYWDPRWLLLVSHGLRGSSSAGLVCASLSVAFAACTFIGHIFWTSHMTGLENRTEFQNAVSRKVVANGCYNCTSRGCVGVCVCVRARTPTYHTHPPNRSWGGELYPLYLWCVGHPHRLFVGLNSSTFMKGKALLKTLLSW